MWRKNNELKIVSPFAFTFVIPRGSYRGGVNFTD
jgi:hypothetical protein